MTEEAGGAGDPRAERQEAAAGGTETLQIALLGDEVSLDCTVESEDVTEVRIWWQKDGENLTQSLRHVVTVETSEGVVASRLVISGIGWEDAGSYSCRARDGVEGRIEKNRATLSVQAKPVNTARTDGTGAVTEALELSCQFEGRPVPAVTWLRAGSVVSQDPEKYEITEDNLSDKTVKSLLKILNLSHEDNGTYLCHGKNAHNSDTAIVNAFVLDSPAVQIDYMVAVSSSKLYINWTVVDWNQPVTGYILSYREGDTNNWQYHMVSQIDSTSTSYLMSNLSRDASYTVKMAAKNAHGTGEFNTYHTSVRTLDFDPVFIPDVSIKGITRNSISVGWTEPPAKFQPHIHFYRVTKHDGEAVAEVVHTQPFPLHLWSDLLPATPYTFTVAACNQYSGECSPPSPTVPGNTYDGLAGPPARLSLSCRTDNISQMSSVSVKWAAPLQPNGVVEFYNIELTGRATYLDPARKPRLVEVEPQTKTEDAESVMTRFDFLEANTNYSARVCAVTGSQECGAWRSGRCNMPAQPPPGLAAATTWHSLTRPGHNTFKLSIPRLSERAGEICCIKVVVVLLAPGQAARDLPAQSNLTLATYSAAHQASGHAAYVAEIISTLYMGREIEIGDGKSIGALGVGRCPACRPPARDKRFTQQAGAVQDGPLDDTRNYTAFLSVVLTSGQVGYSPYFEPRQPGVLRRGLAASPNTVLVSVLGILAGLVLVALILMIVLFSLRRYSKQVCAIF